MTETTDDLPARLEAVLTERFTELGNPFSAMRRHEKGPDGWPASHPVGPHQVAEVLRELLAPAAPVPPPAPTDRAAILREAEAALRAQGKHLAGEFNDSDILHEDGPASAVATWQRAADLVRRMAVEAPAPNRADSETEAPICGAWGGCPLPRGHNMGQADVPSNHQPAAVSQPGKEV